MKKTLIIALCFVAMASIVGAVIMEDRPHPLFINGKPFGNAVMISGNLMMSVQDFAKALNGTPNLGPNFQIQGNRLVALVSSYSNPHASAPANTIGGVQAGQSAGTPGAIILQNNAFHVRKAGEVSSHLTINGGKTFIPLADVSRAFGGGVFTPPANLATGQPVNLNFAVNGDGVLAFGH